MLIFFVENTTHSSLKKNEVETEKRSTKYYSSKYYRSSGTKKNIICEISHIPPKSDFTVKNFFGVYMYIISYTPAIIDSIFIFVFLFRDK